MQKLIKTAPLVSLFFVVALLPVFAAQKSFSIRNEFPHSVSIVIEDIDEKNKASNFVDQVYLDPYHNQSGVKLDPKKSYSFQVYDHRNKYLGNISLKKSAIKKSLIQVSPFLVTKKEEKVIDLKEYALQDELPKLSKSETLEPKEKTEKIKTQKDFRYIKVSNISDHDIEITISDALQSQEEFLHSDWQIKSGNYISEILKFDNGNISISPKAILHVSYGEDHEEHVAIEEIEVDPLGYYVFVYDGL